MEKSIQKTLNVPNLRFPGFSGEWEVKRLGEISQINPKNENLPNLFTYIDLESVINGLLLKEEIISKNEAPSRAQRVLVKKDILFQMVRPYQKNNLFFDKDGEFVASTGYAQIRTDQTPQFIFQYLHNQKFVDKVIERCTGTSYPAINSSDLGNIQIHYPNSKEQNKIARFLGLLDERIQTQSKIIEGLKTLKITVAKKIFSQQLRFKDEKGNDYPEWEEKKLEEVCEKKSSNISANKIEDNFGEYIVYGASGILKNVDFYEEENDYISIVKDGAGVGRLFYCKGKSSVLGTMDLIKPKDTTDTYFLFCLLGTIDFIKYVTGSTIPHIYFKDYKNEYFEIPSIQEQTKIANFLSSIDVKINIENELLRKLEKQKKFLLQNLFV
mgnify:CR=1 FL=1